MWDFIAKPFAIVMKFIYETLAFQNYGLAIIIFTLFVKLLILPLTIKQQRSTLMTQKIQPELDRIKESYGNDRQKLYEEQQKIYQKYGVNSMAGCLPMLIQFPIIIVLYQIIRMPLTYISGMAKDAINSLVTIADAGLNASNELSIVSFFTKNADKFNEACQSLSMTAQELSEKLINMKFLGIFDLGVTPRIDFWAWGEDWNIYLPLLLIPFVAVGTAYLQQFLTMPRKKKGEKKDPSQGALNIMTKVLPLMTLVFAFILPAGLGIYFIVSNIISMLLTLLINAIYKKKKEGIV